MNHEQNARIHATSVEPAPGFHRTMGSVYSGQVTIKSDPIQRIERADDVSPDEPTSVGFRTFDGRVRWRCGFATFVRLRGVTTFPGTEMSG
jgi:hypothetical protein